MDINSLISESPKVITVMNAIKNDPNLISEFKTNPQEAMNKIGVELNEEELGVVQKLSEINELKDEAKNIWSLVKGWFGIKDTN